MMRSFRIRAYDEDTGYGLLRHVLVRKGYHSGQIMVVLVLVSPILPSKIICQGTAEEVPGDQYSSDQCQ